MTARVIIGIVALVSVSLGGILSTLVGYEIMDKVNDKLLEGEQFDALGWHPAKRQRLHDEYRRLYPDGPLLFKLRLLMALTFFCLLTFAWSIGFFGL